MDEGKTRILTLDLSNGQARIMIGIGLVSAAMLLYQIAFTRILSATIWYHYSFLCISLAMLGIGAPGVWFCFFKPTRRALSVSLISGGIAIAASILIVINGVGHLSDFGFAVGGFFSFVPARVLVSLLLIAAVMLSLGSVICLLLLAAPGKKVGAVYGADLLGATLGAALVVPLLHIVPTPQLIAASAFLPLVAHLVLFPAKRLVPALLIVLVGASLFFETPYQLRYTKSYKEPKNLLYERWTPNARLAIFPRAIYMKDADGAWMWGQSSKHPVPQAQQLWLDQDGSAGTPIMKLDKPIDEYGFLLHDVTSLGYQLVNPDTACIIGAGGGRDILTALVANTKKIDAVELNPYIVKAVSEVFGQYTGDIYHRPGVRPHTCEGRSFLTRSGETYDLIQISLIDSWAATAAGSFALSENYLYTKEAIQLYLDRLNPGGATSITRWSSNIQALEMLRLIVLARQALLESGVEQPERHLVVSRAGAVSTVLIFNEPLSPDRVDRLADIEDRQGFGRLWPPSGKTSENSLVERLLLDTDAGVKYFLGKGIDLRAPTDDKPFYFQTLTLLGDTPPELLATYGMNEHSVLLLRGLLVVVGLITFLLFFFPFLVKKALPRPAGFWHGSLYFAAIGLSFMLVEAVWIQRFILYLGHPSYATTVVLATLLFGLGTGSMVSTRVGHDKIRTYSVALPLVLLATNAVLDVIFPATLGWPATGRVAISILLVAPSGFLMGFAFPTGMRRYGDENKAWNWAINGAAGVLATVASLALSMLIGFRSVVLLGVAGYFVAVLMLRMPFRKDTSVD